MAYNIRMRVQNRKARHDYHILESLEAGIVLTGPEVKSLREGRADLTGSFARIVNGEVFLKNAFIPPYNAASIPDYDPRRDRKLLLHKKQIDALAGKTAKSLTLMPLSIYEKRNMMKAELAVAASKKKFDKRKAIKARDEQRKIEQELRGYKDNDSRRV